MPLFFCFLHHVVILYYTLFGVDAFVELYAEIKAKSETNTAIPHTMLALSTECLEGEGH